jgi:biotin carboxyl carrier protein
VRFYDAKLVEDLAHARAVAGKFNAQPYIVAGLAARGVPAVPLVLGFPSPTTTPVAAAGVLPAPAAAPAAPAPRAKATPPASPSLRAQLTPAREELAAAQKKLAATDEELAARQQLQESGVLAPEEVARFEAQRNAAAAAVNAAQRKVLAEAAAAPATATRPASSATGAPLPMPKPAPLALPPVPALPAPPAELQRLSMPRWEDLFAPTGGLVFRPMVPPGTLVKKGAPIMKVVNSAWAHLRLVVPGEQALRFDRALPVTVSFPEVPGLRFSGMVTGKCYAPGDNRVVVDLLVTWPEEPYRTQSVLLAMAYASPAARDARDLELAVKPPDQTATVAGNPLFGLLPTLMVASQAQEEARSQDGPLVGRVALVPPVPQFGPAICSDPKAAATLQGLHDWQNSFVDGMTTAIYNEKLLLSYPRTGEMSQVVEKMMKGEVEHDPGYCARTLRLALGWGLGDAYNWAVELPKRGWASRDDGLPRPGDILVWPFTYGRNHSQHIGVAVRQNGQMMLLSNLGGRLGTSEILGGYLSFYLPTTEAGPGAVPLPVATGKR